MNMVIGTEAARFLFWEYINLNFFALHRLVESIPGLHKRFQIRALFIQVYVSGCARCEPRAAGHLHLRPNVFCLHERAGKWKPVITLEFTLRQTVDT
jgi:hypothetical protein